MTAALWTKLARKLVQFAPRGKFAIVECCWRIAAWLRDSDYVATKLDGLIFDLQPLRHRTEFYLYCLRDQFPNRADAIFTTTLVRPGETIVDLGANIGNFALP